jgi:hypothetical protein
MPYNFNNNKIPNTLEDAVNELYNSMTKKEMEYIKENGAISCHFGMGGAIRNNWGLWKGSCLQEHFKSKYGLGHADDMSGLILLGLDNLCNGKPYDEGVLEEVERYKRHWANGYSIDPLTQESL